jgi:hypothetical protein
MPSNDTHSYDLPHPILTTIDDANTEPTFASILITHIELNANTASVYSARGGGLLGHLALTINSVDYKSRSKGNVDFDPPINPPASPTHKDNATEAEIVDDNRKHTALRREFVQWHNVDAVLRNLLIAAGPGIFLATMKNPATGFGNVTCLKLLTHLHNNYGNITEQELEANVLRMRAQWNPPTAIESLFVQIEDGVAFTAEGLDEPTKPTILRRAYGIVAKTGRYGIACREWCQLHPDPSTKNWAKFKTHFKAADRDMRSQDTTGSTGYHGAHATTNAAANTATLLTTTQAALAASEIKLAHALSPAPLASSSSRSSTRSANTRVSAITTPDTRPRSYCWTHGHTANLEHSSPTCQYPADGHDIAATNENKMGGNNTLFVPHRHPGSSRR